MLFASVLSAALALASPALAAPTLAARDGASIVSSISSINSSISTLNNTLNTFKPDAVLGLFTALQIQQQTTDLGNAVMAGTNTAKSSANLTADESNAVAVAVVGLEPRIQSLLTNIVAHKPAFASAVLLVGDLSKTVQSDLQEQKAYTQSFGDAITAKLAQPYAGFAPLITGQIAGYFDAALQKYATCSGVLCLPSFNP